MSQEYKSRILDPRAFHLADGSGWKAEVDIAEDVDDETIDTPYFLKDVFPTREAALSAALTFGKRMVDSCLEPDKSKDIRSVMEQQTQLPSTHGHGLGRRSDDVAMDIDGPRKVPRPENPEDRFDH
jgi:hypothetical protein